MKLEDFNQEYKRNDFKSLYRQFTSKSHVEEFLSGDIRLGHYYYYKYGILEGDTRYNENEGSIKNVTIRNGRESKTLASSGGLYPIYSVCFSRSLTESLGEFAIELKDAIEFHRRINYFLKCSEKSNYAGNMVYLNSLDLPNNANDSRLMHLYSDSIQNSHKNEFRFSYDIFPKERSEMLDLGTLYIESNFYKNHQHIPYFIHLKGLKVDDLVSVISL